MRSGSSVLDLACSKPTAYLDFLSLPDAELLTDQRFRNPPNSHLPKINPT